MSHTLSLKLGPADLDRLRAVLVRAGIANPEVPYAKVFELLADVETLARTLAAARLAHALEQGARETLRQLARQAEDDLRTPGLSKRMAESVVLHAHQVFGERRPAVDPSCSGLESQAFMHAR
jgi:hypothetical protein